MKKVLSILLCITLLFSLGAIVVQAEAEVIVVNGTPTTATSGAGWTWNGSTLALTNYSGDYIEFPEGKNATITLNGNNTITSSTYGIHIDASTLTISGSGSLTINATDSAIRGDNTSTVTISSGTYELISSGAEALRIDGTLTINGDTVHAKTSVNAPAIVVYGFKLYDNIGKTWLDEVDTHAINFGTNVAYTNSSIKNIDLSLDKTSEGYNDYYDDYYDSSYYSDPGGTGAKWNRSYQYKLIVSATANDVTLDTTNSAWTYTGSYSKDVTIKKTTPATEKITTSKYPLKNAGSTPVIDKIPFNTTVDQLKNNLDNQNSKLKVYNISGKEVTGNALVGTKFVVKLFVNNKEVDKRTLVVLGDVFAQDNVTVNSQDYMMIRQHIMKDYKYITDPILILAADAYSDGTVDSRDYMKIRQIIMGR